MALSRSNLTNKVQSGSGSIVTASVTTTTGGLLVALLGVQKNGGSGINPSTSGMAIANSATAYTWTKRVAVGRTDDFGLGIGLWTAPVSAGQSCTVTGSFSGYTAFWSAIGVFQYTGQDVSPIGASGSKTPMADDGPDSITLSGTPAGTSEVIGGLVHAQNGATLSTATPGTNHTEIFDISTTGECGMQAQVQNIGTASSSFAWADTDAGGNSLALTDGVAIEIKALIVSGVLRPYVVAPPAAVQQASTW